MDGQAGTDQAPDELAWWAKYVYLGGSLMWAFYWWRRGWWPLAVFMSVVALFWLVDVVRSVVSR